MRSRYYLTMELGLVQGGLSKMRADNLPFWLGDGLKVGDYPRSLVKHPKIHTRQTYQKGQVYFGTLRSVSGSVRDKAATGLESEKKCRVWRARFCPSRARAILGLSIRDAKETLIPRALPGRACDSSPHLSNLIIWHYNHHRHAHNVALNQEEKTYGSV